MDQNKTLSKSKKKVDALQSVVLGGATGAYAFCNGVYNLNPAHTTNGFPVFTLPQTIHGDMHLFCGKEGKWCVSNTATMMAGENRGAIVSTSKSPSPLGLQWKVSNADGNGHTFDPAITLNTPAWITSTPPEPWLYRDATITRFNAASHEHTLVFHDLAQTTLHLRLDHFQFLDWDVLPRRRAAMLATRAAVTMMMVMDRVLLKLQRQKLADFTLGKEQQALSFPPGTPALRVLVYMMQNSTKDFETIFREHVWKSVAAPPDLIMAGRVADARRARAAEATAAAAAAAAAAPPSGGGSSSSSSKKKKRGKKKKKKGRRKR